MSSVCSVITARLSRNLRSIQPLGAPCQGRAAAYIVLARLLAPLPQWVTWAVIGVFTMMLVTWTALYAAGHLFF